MAAVLIFHPRFHDLVRKGLKTQTCRGNIASRGIAPGKPISLRTWSEKPYRGPQAVIREATCLQIQPMSIAITRPQVIVRIDGRRLNKADTESFVIADGFKSIEDFRSHWIEQKIFVFKGNLIRWAPD